jgi:hypothetical protein
MSEQHIKIQINLIFSLIRNLKLFFKENQFLINKDSLFKDDQEKKVKKIYFKIIDLYNKLDKKMIDIFFEELFKDEDLCSKISNADHIFFAEDSFNPYNYKKNPEAGLRSFTKSFLNIFNEKYVSHLRKKDPDMNKKFIQKLKEELLND